MKLWVRMKRFTSLALVCALVCSMMSGITIHAEAASSASGQNENLMRIWYDELDDKSEFVFGFDEKSYTDSGTNTRGEAMNWLNKLMGDLTGYSASVDYANIQLDFSRSGLTDSAASNYIRDLDMRTGLAPSAMTTTASTTPESTLTAILTMCW